MYEGIIILNLKNTFRKLLKFKDKNKLFYLVGSFGPPNAGDALILKAWIFKLLKKFPSCKIYVDCWGPDTARNILGNFNNRVRYHDFLWSFSATCKSTNGIDAIEYGSQVFIHKPNFISQKELELILNKIDLMILVGGGNIIKNWWTTYSLLSAIIFIKNNFSLKVVASGQSFIPYDQSSLEKLTEIINKLDYISFRDKKSYELFNKKINIKYSKYRIDDSFLLENIFRVEEEKNNPKNLKRVFVNVQDDIVNKLNTKLIFELILKLNKENIQFFIVEFMKNTDLHISKFFTKNKIDFEIIKSEEIINEKLIFYKDDFFIGTRFHFHLIFSRLKLDGVYACADEYYRNKHDSILDYGSNWAEIKNPKIQISNKINIDKIIKNKNNEFELITEIIK